MLSPNNLPVVRYCGPELAGEMAALHAECFPNYWDHSAFNNFFQIEGTKALVVEEAGSIIAMLVYRLQFEQADIITLAVKKAHRRKGLAMALLKRALDDMRKAGVAQLFLDVEDGNEAALSLYNGLGFSELKRRRLYYRQKDGTFTDALVMTKKFA